MTTDNTQDHEGQLDRCPVCKSPDLERGHSAASFALPECFFWRCADCRHEWGHA